MGDRLKGPVVTLATTRGSFPSSAAAPSPFSLLYLQTNKCRGGKVHLFHNNTKTDPGGQTHKAQPAAQVICGPNGGTVTTIKASSDLSLAHGEMYRASPVLDEILIFMTSSSFKVEEAEDVIS